MNRILITLLLMFSCCVGVAQTTDVNDDSKDSETTDSDISQILNSVGYPELQVVPRASERLRMEAKSERGNWFYSHWPIQLSGLATYWVGMTSRNNRAEGLEGNRLADANTVSTLSTTLGAGWVIGGLLLGAQKPYTVGTQNLAKMKGKDERSVLTRERLAEEYLEKPARVLRVLEVASVISNVGMNSLNFLYSNDKGKINAGLGIALAFLPLMFSDPSIDVYDKHIEYKRKIYAPLKTGGVHYDPYSKTLTPMTNLVWLF